MENMNYREFNFNVPSFVGYVSGTKIFNTYNQQVGVTNEEYNKAVNLAKEYKKVLEDKGIIEKPKTPEELLKESISQQNEVLLQMTQTIKELNEKVSTLEKKNEQTNDNDRGKQIFIARKDK